MPNIRMIDTKDECIGKYASRKKAEQLAKIETARTGRKHHAFLTHYHCPYTFEDIMCWTVIITQSRAAISAAEGK